MENTTTLEEIQSFKGKYPKQLWMLFFAEMWERFTFYGMRALLMLFMTQQMHFEDNKANLTYGAYQAFVYTMPLWGGWLADRLIGQRIAILWGGIMMAIGNFMLAIPGDIFFFLGLGIIIVGNGFFKPNISTMVGSLYTEKDERRDSGFSLFYMGINIGAMLGGLIVGYVGQEINWHLGFAIAGFFMLLGLFVFYKGQHNLGPIGLPPENSKLNEKSIIGVSNKYGVYVLSIILTPIFAWLLINYKVIDYLINPLGILMLLYVLYLGYSEGWDAFKKILVALVLIIFSSLFWAFYEQGGGSLNLYADRNVDMNVFGIQLSSAAVNNSISGLFIVLLSPFFGWLWIALSNKNANPDSVVKFALGILQLAIAFYMFVLGAKYATDGRINFMWFILAYTFMTSGELCLSPIGLSAITKLSPTKMVGLMMGMWFFASAFGQYVAGIIGSLMSVPTTAGQVSSMASLPVYTEGFRQIAYFSLIGGILLLILSPLMKKLMGNTKA
jgi:proton-dependent oligopeptide transporter, POT family